MVDMIGTFLFFYRSVAAPFASNCSKFCEPAVKYLFFLQKINNKHTMMVPDMHIEPLYYGVIIAMVLLPVQWVLEMIFKMSNKLVSRHE